VWSAGFVAVLWLSEIIDTALGNRLDAEGIRPGSTDGLSGILFAPLLHGGVARLVFRKHTVADGGDHTILIGRVVQVDAHAGGPLLYYRGTYRGLAPRDD
jgi:flavin reductase (DIM6/NTAB) family NADH-FMN oxidoreductase RutF